MNGRSEELLASADDFILKPLKSEYIPLRGSIDFSVTTDSVVATATVRAGIGLKRITLNWGDGDFDTLTTRPGSAAAATADRGPECTAVRHVSVGPR